MKELRFNPLRRILVPTDFSVNADHALGYAASIAAKLRSKIILFHSVKVPVVVLNETVVTANDQELVRESNQKLSRMKSKMRGQQLPVELETSTGVGFAVDEILNFCSTGKADLIVMGTRGAHGLGEMLFGSNTAEVISKAKCPVLAVPEGAHTGKINKVMFATNYSDNDFQSIFLLTEILKPWNPEIIIVHSAGNIRVENESFERFKEQVMTSIAYDKFYFNLLEGTNTEDVISNFANENHIDIISVSKRKRSLFERIISVSTTRRLAYHVNIPLLVFPAV
jgi:nucleotide-binding universal stress UspA family protein